PQNREPGCRIPPMRRDRRRSSAPWGSRERRQFVAHHASGAGVLPRTRVGDRWGQSRAAKPRGDQASLTLLLSIDATQCRPGAGQEGFGGMHAAVEIFRYLADWEPVEVTQCE